MLTWYECPWFYAWTIRPDLWPPGTDTWILVSGQDAVLVSHWGQSATQDRQAHNSNWGIPGVAEAMALAGHISQGTPSAYMWSQCRDPRPRIRRGGRRC